MNTGVSSISPPTSRREDFPVESFQYLEAKLQLVRKLAMDAAAEIAGIDDSNPDVYRIEKKHVDHALASFLGNPIAAQSQLGVRLLSSKSKLGPAASEAPSVD
jgi:hypothetical protein